jgi:RNA polymerase sigma factor (sigma-70 family)
MGLVEYGPFPPKDEHLIQGFLAGELAAVARMERWISAAAKPFRHRLADQWEDLRQEVMAELTRLFSSGCFRGESSLISYVWRVATHACIRQMRHHSRWPLDAEAVRMLERHRDSRPSVAERLLERERLEEIRRIAAQLGEECRQLWQRVLAGQSYQEMSRELGVGEGALRVRVLRCRRKAVALREEAENVRYR